MSEAALSTMPIEWQVGGKTHSVAPRDIDCELMFAARHRAWAANDLEAIRGMVSPAHYASRLAHLGQMSVSNEFAFGGPISESFLVTREGMVEYALLLLQKGAVANRVEPITRAALDALSRADGPEWQSLWREVLLRDFPLLAARMGLKREAPSPPSPE